MMAFSFRQLANTFYKSEGLRKILELERPLNASILIEYRPFGRIAMIPRRGVHDLLVRASLFIREPSREEYYTVDSIPGTHHRSCESW
jgi:hypothetical protein